MGCGGWAGMAAVSVLPCHTMLPPRTWLWKRITSRTGRGVPLLRRAVLKRVRKMLIDTHAHLDFPDFVDIPAVLDRAEKAGVREVVTIGTDLDSSRKAVDLAGRYPQIYAAVGVHPQEAVALDEGALSVLRDLARQPRVVAVGEIGLDYYRDYRPRDLQRECLDRQLDMAAALRLPPVFHIRDAFDDFFEIVAPHVPSLNGGVLHCFSGDWAIAERCLNWGFYLSVPGTVTFPKSEVLRDVVRRAPSDRLLVETDAPYLTPVPFRGKVNEPSLVYHTAAKVAELRGCSLERIGAETTANAHRVFGIAGRGDEADAK